jgi:hypothetical protein
MRPSQRSPTTASRTCRYPSKTRATDRLVAVVLPVGLLAMEAEGPQDRRVPHREEDRLPVDCRVPVPGPGWDDKEVALPPVEALPVDADDRLGAVMVRRG